MLEQMACPAEYKSSGLFRTENPWIHPHRVVDTYEIMVVVAGQAYIYEEERQHTICAGEAIVLRPGLRHGGWKVSEGDTSFYWIHFTARQAVLAPLPCEPQRIHDPSQMNLLCRQLLHVDNAPGYPDYAAQAAFELVFCEISRLSEQERPSSRRVIEIAEWIRLNSHRALTVALVAEHAGYHPDHLSVLFRDTFHMSLKQYIIDQRMQQIRSQLLTTTDSLKQIAARLGFSGENQLMHYFRYHERISPTAYRNMYHRTYMNDK